MLKDDNSTSEKRLPFKAGQEVCREWSFVDCTTKELSGIVSVNKKREEGKCVTLKTADLKLLTCYLILQKLTQLPLLKPFDDFQPLPLLLNNITSIWVGLQMACNESERPPAKVTKEYRNSVIHDDYSQSLFISKRKSSFQPILWGKMIRSIRRNKYSQSPTKTTPSMVMFRKGSA